MMVGREVARYRNLVRNVSNWYGYLPYKLGIHRPPTLRFITRAGFELDVPSHLIRAFKEIFMTENYQKHFPDFDESEVRTIIDIGANVGFFSFHAVTRYPNARVYAYEPWPANFRILERNLRTNPGAPITAVASAVSRARGEISFHVDSEDSISTSASVVPLEGLGTRVSVPSVRLEDVFLAHGIERCDFLKVDCEGAEYEILLSTPPEILSRIDRIAMEVHEVPGHEIAELRALLERNGFVVVDEGKSPLWMLWAWRAVRESPSR